ncbi:unnamed protein product [Mytilus coruscus]|uniref:Reverse transcriptase/retrotransposon-derived protein RNase H-like domain-containing protein n=1 Tax=Mytilus coruscus TaxID=42192 RepID=A0A6J8BW67_MYTCO|nr:unnamed protein product [Mytilus coruscus]
MCQKGDKFIWDDSCDEGFKSLKEALIFSPILSYPMPNKPFILDTDASNKALGGVLSQEQDGAKKEAIHDCSGDECEEPKYEIKFQDEKDDVTKIVQTSVEEDEAQQVRVEPENSLKQKLWDTFVPQIVMAYRLSIHSSTGKPPNKMISGREVTLPLQAVIPTPYRETDLQDVNEYVEILQKRFQRAHEEA